ncbi:MAG: TonB-dependent receptor [Saprospiraceae bacterium]
MTSKISFGIIVSLLLLGNIGYLPSLYSQDNMVAAKPVKEYFNYKPLSQVLDTLISKYDFKINYDLEDVSPYKLTYLFTGTKPESVIRICLDHTDLSYAISEKGVFKIYNKTKITAQKILEDQTRYQGKPQKKDFTIKGIVKDRNTGETLPYVNISIAGTDQGVNTNVDGYFTLLSVPSDTVGLLVSYIGYQSITFYLNPKLDPNNIMIPMLPQSQLLNEVIVSADREEILRANEKISMLKMSPVKIAALPSIGEKDVMRSFQLMPGVSAANENSSGLYVRGGTPDQTLVLYDGFNVYHVEHLFGFFSAFNSNAIKDVQLYKGGFESKFGGRISSVAEITGKEGNAQHFNLGINAGLLAANATAEIPIGDKVTTLFAFRRSYQSGLYNKIFNKYGASTNQVIPGSPPAGGGGGGRFNQGFNFATTTPKSFFYDLNGKITFKPTQKDILTLSVYNGTDNMDNSRTNSFGGGGGFGGGGFGRQNFNLNTNDQTNWGNTGGSFKWSHRFSKSFYLNSLISYSNYFSTRDRRSDNTITDSSGAVSNNRLGSYEDNNLLDYSAKVDMEWKLNQYHQLEFGVGTTLNDIKYLYSQNDTVKIIDRHTTGYTSTAYVQDRWTYGKLSVIPGLRIDHFSPTQGVYFEPRLSAAYNLTERIKLKAAYGHYYQFVKRVVREDVLQGSRDFWVLADNVKLPVAKAIHYIAGASYENKNWLFDAEIYLKDITGLSEYSLRIKPAPRSISYEEKFAQGEGIAKGLDLLVQKKYGKLNGWMSYSLGSVKYDFADFGKPFYANQDVRHEFKMVGIYSYKNWDFSATWIYASGRPYTSPAGGYVLKLLDGTTRDFITVTDKNGVRLPDYHRMDVAATYKWQSLKGAPRSISLSLFNLYGRVNTWYKEFQIESGQILETNVSFLGFTPNLSVSWQLR